MSRIRNKSLPESEQGRGSSEQTAVENEGGTSSSFILLYRTDA